MAPTLKNIICVKIDKIKNLKVRKNPGKTANTLVCVVMVVGVNKTYIEHSRDNI